MLRDNKELGLSLNIGLKPNQEFGSKGRSLDRMRVTAALLGEHTHVRKSFAQLLQWGHEKNGRWGRKPAKYVYAKQWQYIWKMEGKRKIQDMTHVNLPPGVTVYEATEVAKDHFQPWIQNLTYPWPHTVPGDEGTVEDPKYRREPGLIFQTFDKPLEGFKGVMNFANTVCESSERLPRVVEDLEEEVELNAECLDLLHRRLAWCREGDSHMTKMPRIIDFPKVNIRKRREYGAHPVRRERNTLRAFYDCSDLFVAHNYGFVDRRRIVAPYCVVPFQREGKLVVLDLGCDFITTSSRVTEGKALSVGSLTEVEAAPAPTANTDHSLPLFSPPLVTVDKQLEPIHPVDWRISFEESHFYNNDYGYIVPPSSSIHCIYSSFGLNTGKPLPDRMAKGKALMYCYGFAAAQARRLYGNADFTHPDNYKQLINPVTVQLAFINDSKTNIGFVCFQLNTLSFDSQVKNQVWFDGPYDYNLDRERVLRKLVALQLNGADKLPKLVHQSTSRGKIQNN